MTIVKNYLSKVMILLLLIDILFVSIYMATSGPTMAGSSVAIVKGTMQFWFNINGEGNLFSWYSSSKFLMAALLLGIVYVVKGYLSALFGVLLFALMSADEGGQIHENLGLILSQYMLSIDKTVLGHHSQHDWPYLAGPVAVLLIFSVAYIFIKEKVFSIRTLLILSAGLITLLSGAIGLEIISHGLSISKWLYRPDILEEFLELIGSSIIIVGCAMAAMEKIEFSPSTNSKKVTNGALIFLAPIALAAFVVGLYTLNSSLAQKSLQTADEITFPACLLPRLEGVMGPNCTVTHGADHESIMVFGPYRSIPRGSYLLNLVYSSPMSKDKVSGRWDIVHSASNRIVDAGDIAGTSGEVARTQIPFLIKSDGIRDFEFRIYGIERESIVLHQYTVVVVDRNN